MKKELIHWWLRHFVAALLVLLLVKAALVYNNIAGTEGFTEAWKLVPRSLLFLGWDIVGAAALAVVGVLCVLPWLLRRRHRPGSLRGAVIASAFLQALHAIGAGLSFLSAITVGGFVTKAGIDLLFLGSADDQQGIWEAIGHFVTVRNVSILVGLGAIGAASFLLAPRLMARVRGRGRFAAAGLLAGFAAVTVVALPFLINGEVAGIRIHTYGLERSPGIEFGHSYLAPLLPWRRARREAIVDQWRLDLSPIAASDETGDPPLRAAKPRRTNVVMVALESVGQPYLSEPANPMPFAMSTGRTRDGAFFEQHYSTWPQTTKALFSLLCSELPHPHYLPISASHPAIPAVSLSEALHASGYRTAFITAADLAYERMIRFFRHRQFDVIRDLRQLREIEGAWHNAWGVDERVAVQAVFDQIDQWRDGPFFVLYGMSVAHHPYHVSAEHEANSRATDRENYEIALEFIDQRLADIDRGLQERGLLQDTLVVVVSDHGEGFGQHVASLAHGPTLYQENIHVPWYISGPQLAGLTVRSDIVTSHLDVAPTVLGLLAIDVPCTMKGRNLLVDGSPRMAIMAGRPPSRQVGLVDGRFKYLRDANGLQTVFDLRRDPLERHDLRKEPDKDDLAARWDQKLDEWEAFSENLIENYAEGRQASDCP